MYIERFSGTNIGFLPRFCTRKGTNQTVRLFDFNTKITVFTMKHDQDSFDWRQSYDFFLTFQLSSNSSSSFSITYSSIFLTQILIFCARQNVIIMTKFHLNVQDQQRLLYWFHMAFKEKSPSKEDGESLKMILSFAQCDIDLVQDVDENDEWDKRY